MIDAPRDNAQRHRFCTDICTNFSVVAPAGVGKTFALVERIGTIAQQQPDWLERLYVITYTNKAAEALRQRTQERLAALGPSVQHALQKSFFGTIHSLCWQQVQRWDGAYELLSEHDASLEDAFLATLDLQASEWDAFQFLFRFKTVDEVLAIANHCDWLEIIENSDALSDLHIKAEAPAIDPTDLLNFVPKNRPSKETIQRIQTWVARWLHDYEAGNGPMLLPECTTNDTAFQAVFQQTFLGLQDRLSQDMKRCCRQLWQRFFAFRRERGYLTYNDSVVWARHCLELPEAKAYYQAHPICVLLDEAQDTDRTQLRWLESWLTMHPDSQFSMVGDPQQLIYDRASVRDYDAFQKRMGALMRARGGFQSLEFTNTFRCPKAVVNMLNQRFPNILNRENDPEQVTYQPLIAANNSIEGSVATIEMPPLKDKQPQDSKAQGSDEEHKKTVQEKVQHEAEILKEFFANYRHENPEKCWSDVALLVPRNDWVFALKDALHALDLPVQVHSGGEVGRQNRLFCCCLATIHGINFPNETFERIGLLQTVWQCSDLELAESFKKEGVLTDTVAVANDALSQLQQEVAAQSLCAGITRLIDFLQAKIGISTPTDDDWIAQLLNAAFETQRNGQSWLALEERLDRLLQAKSQAEQAEIDPNALQLLTCHKAKGLEWPVVILPFFYRPIHPHQSSYPRIYKEHVVWKTSHLLKQAIAMDQKRELQRLLYVACTRAKSALFWVNDAALWAESRHSVSFGTLLDGR